MLTHKELFCKAESHMLLQGKQSVFDERCVYRHPDGLKCGLGALITDEAYTPELEGVTIESFLRPDGIEDEKKGPMIISALEKSGIPTDRETLELLDDIQTVHDCHEPDAWKTELQKIADRILEGFYE